MELVDLAMAIERYCNNKEIDTHTTTISELVSEIFVEATED